MVPVPSATPAPNIVAPTSKDCSKYPGADAAEKIQACLAGGGVADARSIIGGQRISKTIIVTGANQQLLLGQANYAGTANPFFDVRDCRTCSLIGSGTTLSLQGDNASAITYNGTVDDLAIEGLNVVGDSISARQQGFWNPSGQTLNNIRIRNNRISRVILGISLNADLGGSVTGSLIEGNTVTDVFGTVSGSGYGIHHSSPVTISSGLRILNNTIERAGRHSIYQGRGRDVTISGNVIKDHKLGLGSGTLRAAVSISRSINVVFTGNTILNATDGAIAVDTDGFAPCSNITLTGNLIDTIHSFYAVSFGSQRPDLDGFCQDIIFNRNRIAHDAAVDPNFGGALHQIFSGKRIQVLENDLSLTNSVYRSAAFQIRGSSEGSGTAIYTDQLTYADNKITLTSAGGPTHGWEFYSTAATSSIAAGFYRNSVNVSSDVFMMDVRQTNRNITVVETPTSGLDLTL
jgi:hypothetical protein